MKSIYILAALTFSGAKRLSDDSTTVSPYPNFLIRKAEQQLDEELHEANHHDA